MAAASQMGGDASRLIYGYAGGRRHGPRRTALGIAAARALDYGSSILGAAQPVLLVSGFWRGGTTWLQESLATALGAKTIFEPLSPMEPAWRQALMARFPGDTEDLRQATVPGPCPYDDALWRHLDPACGGRISTPYLLSCRRDVAESLRQAIVVKDVRLQANLAAFHHRYHVPVVHVRRHPCAAVASLIAADWHWSFAHAPLARLVPRLGGALDGIDTASVLRFDTDALSRIAAFWALTERIAEAALDHQPWGMIVAYETFAARPAATLTRICRRLGLAERQAVDFTRPAASVHPDAFAAYAVPPSERWRTLLSDAERDRVTTIVDTIHPRWRNATALHA